MYTADEIELKDLIIPNEAILGEYIAGYSSVYAIYVRGYAADAVVTIYIYRINHCCLYIANEILQEDVTTGSC